MKMMIMNDVMKSAVSIFILAFTHENHSQVYVKMYYHEKYPSGIKGSSAMKNPLVSLIIYINTIMVNLEITRYFWVTANHGSAWKIFPY